MKEMYFKKCMKCGKLWLNRDEFLDSDELVPVGFQAHFLDGDKSSLLFTHKLDDCNTTLGVPLALFSDLIPGFKDSPNLINSSVCPGLCLTDTDLTPCSKSQC
ncbi:MAG: hypothetical protein WAN36_15140, partial [Calditrichia bacterium]